MVEIGTNAGGEYRMAAIGKPLEWDQIVPFFGRKQIVKGVSYSYQEFTSPALMSDKDWRDRSGKTPLASWIAPFVSGKPLSCPPHEP